MRHACCSVWLWSVLATGCVELPSAPDEAASGAPDASLFVLDGGARRPPTAEGPAAPGCWLEPSAGGTGAGLAPAPRVGGTGAGGAGAGLPPADAPGRMPRAPSEVVITELMPNPAQVPDDDGEWLELHNPSSDTTLELQGCALDDGGATKPLADPLQLAPGGFATLARSALAGFVPDATLSFSLANEADAIALSCEGVVIDRVAYGPSFPLAPGVSTALDPGAFDAAANDDPTSWCPSASSTYAEQGTPGAPNPPCHGDVDAGP